ncbi:zinc knuckle CX2CX4HX4C containing protein [Tanacetum coccineum]
MLRDGLWMTRGIIIFLNKWPPSVSLLKEDLSRVRVWVKFHDVMLVAYTSYGLSLIATKIGSPMMLDSYTNSMRWESWGRSNYAIILIKINASNDFSDNLIMAVLNLEGIGYTKETIPLKRVVNIMDKGKGGSSRIDDEGFTKVKKKKSGGNDRAVRRLLTSSNGTFSLSNSFENSVNEEVETSNKAFTYGVQEEGQLSTPLGSEDEVEFVDNEMASYLTSKMSEALKAFTMQTNEYKKAELSKGTGARVSKERSGRNNQSNMLSETQFTAPAPTSTVMPNVTPIVVTVRKATGTRTWP